MLTPRWATDRFTRLTVVLLVLITAVAWVEVIRQASSMGPLDVGGMDMNGQMPATEPLIDAAGLVAFVGAWGVMMAAMMLPSALPMILLYRTAASKQAAGSSP